METHNCENCGKIIAPGSGVTHATFFESWFGKTHYFCCKKCRDAAIDNGTVKKGSNGCLIVIFLIILGIIIVAAC